MFWEQDLTRLAERKRSLAEDCARDRERVSATAADVARHLTWVGMLPSLYARYRPLLLVGLPLAGLFLGKRLPRLARWSALAAPLWRVARGFLRLRRLMPR